MSVHPPPSRLRVFGHPSAPASSSSSSEAREQAGRLEGRARRLLDHLRRDWPAMDVVLSSSHGGAGGGGGLGQGKGKGRSWGERMDDCELLASSSRAAPTASISSTVGPGQPSTLKHRKKRRTAPPELDTTAYAGGLGWCFGVVALPHDSHTRHYHLPDPAQLARQIRPFPLPAPSSSSSSPSSSSSTPVFRPPKPGRLRGKWIVPVHGPVVGCPGASGAWLASDGQEAAARAFVEHRVRERKGAARALEQQQRAAHPAPLAESTRSNSQEHLPLRSTSTAKPPEPALAADLGSTAAAAVAATTATAPPLVVWTTPLLRSFHKALLALVDKNHLGPVSVVLHRSTLPPSSSPAPPPSSSAISFGDHYRIYVDLAYALNVRELLDKLDLRLEARAPDGGGRRVQLLEGARLALVGDVGQVLLVA